MKNKMYLLLVSTFSLCLFSCSDVTKEDTSVLTENNTRNIILADGLTIGDLEERNRYIDENYELFDGIKVFNSSQDIFSLLSEVDTMSYTSLYNWCIRNDCYNQILESRIIYETIFSEVLEEFGYSYNEYVHDEGYTIALEDTVFETFKERMINEFPDKINISEDYDAEYGIEYCIEPLYADAFDELIFMNDRNLLIVGLNVYKLVEDILLSTSVYNFNEEFANLMSVEDVNSYLSSAQASENVFYANLSSNNDTPERLPFRWTEKRHRLKMKIKIRAFDTPNWKGNIIRQARLSVNNYKYGCWKRVYTTIDMSVDLIGREDVEGEGFQTFYFQDNGKFFLKTCKDSHMRHSPLGSNIIYLVGITGRVENYWGLSVNFF